LEKFFITTAIDYVNAKPHIGHAYEKVTADITARYKRMLGFDVLFSAGTDEHSINVYTKAVEQGKDPKAYCDEMAKVFKDVYAQYQISCDDFIQTTEDRHKKAVAELFKRSFDAGDIYKGNYEGWYCRSCEAFYVESDLVDCNCPVHKTKPDVLKEENYFLKLTKYSGRLLKHIEENPGFIEPETRRNEIVNMIKEGLRDISVSRHGQKWGIPLSFDPEHKVYVWFDALINYITVAGFTSDEKKFAKYWPADVHVIGKDIIKFHCIIWPIMLMSAGIPLPKKVFGHGFLLSGGEKMSKTRGNVVDPVEIAANPFFGASALGTDPIRYFFASHITNGQDGECSEEAIKTRYNNDLANDFGNLINRSLNMVEKYFAGVVPAMDLACLDAKMNEMMEMGQDFFEAYKEKMDVFDLSGAMETAWRIVRFANKLIEDEAPWNLQKQGKMKELAGVMYLLCESIRLVALAIAPVMPKTAAAVLNQNLKINLNMEKIDLKKEMEFGKLTSGQKIEKGLPLFPRIEAPKNK